MMKCLGSLAIAVATAFSVASATAQDFPNRTVRFVVPFTPGGANDITARALAERMTKIWGQPVIVENRPGAGTTVGMRAVIDAAPDGHTLLFTSSTSLVVTPHTTELTFDIANELAPVIKVVGVSPALAVSNSTPANTLPELLALAKAKPGQLTYATAGAGTYSHVAMEYFKHMAGVDMLHVPYKGSSPILADMMGGRIDTYMVALSVFQELEKAGKLKVVAMGTAQKHPLRPDLPTIGEFVPGFAVDVWFGFAAPAKTPGSVLDKIHADMTKAMNDPSFIEAFVNRNGFTLGNLSREQFTAEVAEDYKLWGKMVEIAGMKRK